ncbi:MAG TPA: hypothetical protein VIO80_08110 [Candidatus Dormibacteraeota bacterium]
MVFPSERGTLADGPNVTHRFHKLLKRAELPPMRFHDLRHACASLLLVQGVHPESSWRPWAIASGRHRHRRYR